MTDYAQQSLETYLDDLAAKKETPGGGSASALSAALAAGLASMVCQYTIGKKKYADVEDEIKTILEKTENLRAKLLQLTQKDVDVFENEMAKAFSMPKDTDQQQTQRKQAIQQACKAAAAPPIETAGACRDLCKLLVQLAQKGSKMLISDVGVALAMAKGAFDGARYNIDINLNYIDDTGFVQKITDRVRPVIDEVNSLHKQGTQAIQDRSGKK